MELNASRLSNNTEGPRFTARFFNKLSMYEVIRGGKDNTNIPNLLCTYAGDTVDGYSPIYCSELGVVIVESTNHVQQGVVGKEGKVIIPMTPCRIVPYPEARLIGLKPSTSKKWGFFKPDGSSAFTFSNQEVILDQPILLHGEQSIFIAKVDSPAKQVIFAKGTPIYDVKREGVVETRMLRGGEPTKEKDLPFIAIKDNHVPLMPWFVIKIDGNNGGTSISRCSEWKVFSKQGVFALCVQDSKVWRLYSIETGERVNPEEEYQGFEIQQGELILLQRKKFEAKVEEPTPV